MPPRKAVYKAQLNVPVTQEMYDFVDLMAARNHVKKAEVVREAIRAHLDIQEDLITSRSRLGRTVMGQLEVMHRELLRQLITLSKLLLAAILILLDERGIGAGPATKRILNLAGQPALDRLVKSGK